MNARDNRRTKTIKPAPKPEAGPRPLSERQRGHLSHLRAAHVGRPEAVLHRTVVSVQRVESKAGKGTSTAPFRSGAATARRQREKSRQNRKRINWAKVLLQTATVALCAEVIAALIFSPRLRIRTVAVEGNATVPTERLMKRLAIAPDTNLLELLYKRGRLLQAVRAEPTVAGVTIHPRFPDGLVVSVTERQPFAAVKFDSEPGRWYTLDKNRVPFRFFEGLPEADLPLVSVATRGEATGKNAVQPVLGIPCVAPGLADVGDCLTWARQQGANFPVEKVTIDNAGKLCLNRVGGMTVLLGPGMDLNEKLGTLSLLLLKRTDLRGSAPTQIAKVNLYAYDAPALVPREDTGQTVDGEFEMP
ncbi:MAG: FtsQ-type POTRA domain-containing protein [Akkermansiaceae bacterium]|nr:FtsQ-type POTRA domain-containing protein [Armatimonadota bacterium]